MTVRPWYRRAGFVLSLLLASAGVLGTAVATNLSYDVTDPDDYAVFPPFKAGVNSNHNDHLGGEYLKIAEALVAGRGYADPFGTPTGPTAWMPPPLTLFQAALLTHFNGDKVAVANVVIVCQAAALWLTALLTLAVARRWAPRVPGVVVVALMALGLATRFHTAFQVTHDSWVVLLALDGLVAFALWGHFPASAPRALAWGVGGGLSALVSPVLGACWGVLTLAEAARSRRLRPLLVAAVACALTVSPWVARNAVVLGRFIPVKSNLAYELYQSQLLSTEGRLSDKVFASHPFATHGAERAEYAALGEVEFLDRKGRAFADDVRRRPEVFAAKVADRFLAATLDYTPMDPKEAERKGLTLLCQFAHPLPFLAACGLLLLAPVVRLPRACWVTLAVLAVYLAPYVLVSYYERYEMPLWGLKTLAIVWLLDALLALASGGPIRTRRLEDRPAAATLALPGDSLPPPEPRP